MGDRKFTLKPNARIEPCPRCGNNTSFVARSQQVAEDCCEVWVECRCGFDPTAEDTGHRVECVWGSLDDDNVMMALSCSWNEPIRTQAVEANNGR